MSKKVIRTTEDFFSAMSGILSGETTDKDYLTVSEEKKIKKSNKCQYCGRKLVNDLNCNHCGIDPNGKKNK
jgi:hypothetical protein